MKTESLAELERAFVRWRRTKRHVRERVPARLYERAQRAVGTYGLTAVVRATKLERSRLVGKSRGETVRVESSPSYSRLELSAPATQSTTSTAGTPIAELETARGLKLRIFTQTPETLNLLSSLCSVGGTP